MTAGVEAAVKEARRRGVPVGAAEVPDYRYAYRCAHRYRHTVCLFDVFLQPAIVTLTSLSHLY